MLIRYAVFGMRMDFIFNQNPLYRLNEYRLIHIKKSPTVYVPLHGRPFCTEPLRSVLKFHRKCINDYITIIPQWGLLFS